MVQRPERRQEAVSQLKSLAADRRTDQERQALFYAGCRQHSSRRRPIPTADAAGIFTYPNRRRAAEGEVSGHRLTPDPIALIKQIPDRRDQYDEPGRQHLVNCPPPPGGYHSTPGKPQRNRDPKATTPVAGKRNLLFAYNTIC
jgi:hypothetical protein